MLRSKYKPLLFWALLVLFLLNYGCIHSGAYPPDTDDSNTSTNTQETVILSSVRVDSQDGGATVALTGLRPFSYELETYHNPFRLTIDIPEGQIEKPEELEVRRDGIQTVSLYQIPGTSQMARLEIHLEEKGSYRVTREGQHLIVRVKLPTGSDGLLAGGQSGSGVLKGSQEIARSADNRPGSRSTQIQERPKNQDVASVNRREHLDLEKASPPSNLAGTETLSHSNNPEFVLQPAFREYRVGPGDELAIDVQDEPELTLTYVVSGEGNLIVRYLGSVHVAGLTAVEITQKLEKLLSDIYNPLPRIAVKISKYKSQRVFVVGAITPQTFTLQEDTTLIEILSQLQNLNVNTHVIVYRRAYSDGEGAAQLQEKYAEAIRVDLERLLRQGDMSRNLILQPRDVIFVPPVAQGQRVSNTMSVLGQVGSPGTIPYPVGGMTLLAAIIQAGGFSQFAMPRRTRVLRISDGKEQTIKVNVSAIMRGKLSQDIPLMPGDVIIVPERSLF